MARKISASQQEILGQLAGIVVPYLFFAGAWVLFSDSLLERLAGSEQVRYLQLQNLKGIFFVIATALLFALLLYRLLLRIRADAARMRGIVGALPGMVWLKSPQGKYLEISGGAARIFGLTPAQIVGRSDHDLLPARLAARLRDGDLAAIKNNGAHASDEWLPFPPDQREEFLHIMKTPLYDDDGTLIGILGIAQDIGSSYAERQAEQQALLQAEVAFHASPAAIALWRLGDGTIIDANDTFVRLFGWRKNELRGNQISELGIWPDDQAFLDYRCELATQGGINAYETTLLDQHGEAHAVSISAKVIDINGQAHEIAFIVDITETWRARQFTSEHSRILRDIAQNAPLAETLGDIVGTVERHFEGLIAAILLLDDDGVHLRVGAAGSLPADYSAAIDGLPVGEGAGSSGTAAFRGERVEVDDIAANPLWARWREHAQKFHIAACWALPITDPKGRVLGTIAVYAGCPGPMPEALRSLLDGLAQTAAIAIHRKRAEAALRANEQRWILALDAAGHGVWDWDLASDRIFYSERCKSLLGDAADEIGNSPEEWISRIHPDEQGAALAAIAAHKEGRLPLYKSEHRMRDSQGNWKWTLDQGMIIERDAAGRPTRMIGTRTDINEFRAALDELKRLQLAVEQSSNSIVITDAATVIQYVNAAFTTDTGYTRSEAIGRPAGFHKSGRTPRETYASLWQALGRGESWRGEMVNRHKNGEPIVFLNSISPVREPDGAVTHYLAVQEDITEKTRVAHELAQHRHHLEELVAARTVQLEEANRRLQISDSRLKAMFEMSQEANSLDEPALLERGLAAAARLSNSALGYLLLFDDAESISLQICTGPGGPCAWPDDDQAGPAAADAWQEIIASRQALIHNNFPAIAAASPLRCCLPADGATLRRHMGVPVLEGGSLRLIIGVANKAGAYDDSDVRELQLIGNDLWRIVMRHRAEAALASAKRAAEAASRAKSDFLANMSHEIRTPMNAIIGLGHLAINEASEPRLKDRLQKIAGAAQHLLAIINDILDLSKIEAGRLTLEESDFALAEVINNLQALFAGRAEEKHLALRCQIDPRLPAMLRGDALRLGQILINYVSNALKFTEHGSIEVRLEAVTESPAADYIDLRGTVKDSGIGISEEAQRRLFTAFEQADVSTTRRFGGTGLGLAISRHLAALMQGEVGLSSAPGQGSTFWFTARLRRAGAALPAPAPQDEPVSAEQLAASAAGARILLVEDNPVNQEVTLELLASAGLGADLAGNGLEALERCRTEQYDLVLMDLQMPLMDGISATRAIRRLENGSMPIIAMTANVLGSACQDCIDAGMNDHVAKPVNPALLFATLRRWLPAAAAGASEPDASPSAAPAAESSEPASAADAALLTRLRAIAGLDVDAGLFAVRGRVAGYRRLLAVYLQSHADAAARLRAAGDRATARRGAHNLKGAAASIGARPLEQIAAEIESALSAADPAAEFTPDAALDAAIDRLGAENHRLCAAIAAALDLPAPDAAAAAVDASLPAPSAKETLIHSVRPEPFDGAQDRLVEGHPL